MAAAADSQHSLEIDNTAEVPGKRAPLILGGQTLSSVTSTILAFPERESANKAWWAAFMVSSAVAGMFVCLVAYLVYMGVGIWGNNVPVGWGFPIVNFVFWVGIGHAGTLISAILFLLRQKWRTSINRFAEAMTIFAVVCALIFPGIHVGRIWFAYWMFPIPNQMQMWPQFRSPLLWDVFAVGTYGLVSLLFWYFGLIPDLATMRDRATSKIRKAVYSVFALGWTGSARHWHRYERTYLILAALATPLVLSVHSVVSFDFAVAQLPGWHTTIFPPYFVAGAIFSGFGMVLTLAIPARQWFGMKQVITLRHLENMSKVILLTGSMVGYAYGMEFFIAWYGANPIEGFTFVNRATGPFWWAYWIMVSCNVISPQLFWFKKFRRSPWLMFVVSIFVNIGMWFERFVITVSSLNRDFLPSSWGYFSPTIFDFLFLIGSFGIFFTLFLLFLRWLPMVAIAEVKAGMPEAHLYPDADQHSDYQPDVRDLPGSLSDEADEELPRKLKKKVRARAGKGPADTPVAAESEAEAEEIERMKAGVEDDIDTTEEEPKPQDELGDSTEVKAEAAETEEKVVGPAERPKRKKKTGKRRTKKRPKKD